MNTPLKRYIFTDFENIQKVKFKKLERICDKIFILINTSDHFIPFSLVRNLQKLGKSVKWIPVKNNEHLTLNYHICYLMGEMHSKVNHSIDFAILSDEDSFESIINYISSNQRKCRRLKIGPFKKKVCKKIVALKASRNSLYESDGYKIAKKKKWEPIKEQQDSLVAYRETKDRLKLIATRPYNLGSLRDYIYINNQELLERGKLSAEDIIKMMEFNKEIEVNKGVVAYHF
ncbi:PIN domain-containing protein [Saprospiraceae bacterium]|nr:PIN domain-containing protein [Saprospiraceae bacterium]